MPIFRLILNQYWSQFRSIFFVCTKFLILFFQIIVDNLSFYNLQKFLICTNSTDRFVWLDKKGIATITSYKTQDL